MKNIIIIVVLFTIAIFGLWLILSYGEGGKSGLIQDSKGKKSLVQKMEMPVVGEVVVNIKNFVTNEASAEELVEVIEEKSDGQKLTTFIEDEEQRINASIMSRGFGKDRIERVQIRGKVNSLSSKKMAIGVGERENVVYLPERIGIMCIPETITSKSGVTHETRKSFLDLTTYNNTIVDIHNNEAKNYLSEGDDVLVFVAHQDGDMVAIVVAGYGCVFSSL